MVCFDQARELAEQTSSERKVPGLSPSYLHSLRKAAAAVEDVPGGHLINFRPSSREAVRRTWDQGERDLPRQTLVQLKIEYEASCDDELYRKIERRVTTADGWASLIHGIQHDDSHAYGVQQLYEWVTKRSRWSRPAKATCRSAFRQGVLQIVGADEEIWACSIGSLRKLAETMITDGAPLTDEEKAVFLSACKLVSGTIASNADDPDDVRGEADELEKMEKICGLVLTDEIAELEGCAEDLVARPSYHGDIDPESDYMSRLAPDSAFDADVLFAGLLEQIDRNPLAGPGCLKESPAHAGEVRP